MRNIKIVAPLAALLVAFAGASHASASKEVTHDKVSYNVGLEAAFYPSTNTLTSSYGGTVLAGLRLNQNLGFELGIGSTSHSKNYTNMYYYHSTNVGKTKGAYIDMLGFLPTNNNKVDVIGALGVGTECIRVKFDSNSHKYRRTGVRIGGGAQYHFNQNWAVRGMGRYQVTPGAAAHLRNINLTLAAIYSF